MKQKEIKTLLENNNFRNNQNYIKSSIDFVGFFINGKKYENTFSIFLFFLGPYFITKTFLNFGENEILYSFGFYTSIFFPLLILFIKNKTFFKKFVYLFIYKKINILINKYFTKQIVIYKKPFPILLKKIKDKDYFNNYSISLKRFIEKNVYFIKK